MSSEQCGAGARIAKAHVATGAFPKRPRQQAQDTVLNKLPPIDPKSLKSYGGGDGALYGALATDTHASGGLTGQAKTNVKGEFVHVPGYAGHRPSGWMHKGRKGFNDKTKVSSKEDSYVSGWGRPAMPSGTCFEYNPKLKETVPRINEKGLVKTSLEDRIEETAKSQVRIVGDTSYAGLSPKKAQTLSRADEFALSQTSSPLRNLDATAGSTRGCFSLSKDNPVPLGATLATSPPGYRQNRAEFRDLAIFEGSFKPSRHIPGYSGHIPGGVRVNNQ
eukprot:TRINITY_DN25233_c0_g1_i1.p1 TRINITY_DN25233_c0_g1~~TRINITY_DN25233_c0_g1_i1.p1  ORF type:complete len:276 (+),score=87.42 TRINITY_DN25233_c0_g1_i1:63-890(+)